MVFMQTPRGNGVSEDTLRIVAWDDPRCTQPLQSAAMVWSERTGDTIEIIKRPLTAFNDQPLLELSPLCDVMIVDYPHIAQALHEGAIVPIETLASEDDVWRVADRAVGRAQESFVVDGVTAAFASDAACHVSAFRPKQMEKLGVKSPTSWEEVFELQRIRPACVAVALYHTDAISSLMSLADGEGAAPQGGPSLFTDNSAAIRATTLLSRLAERVAGHCWRLTPQALFRDAQSRTDISYIPLTFGYSGRTKPENGGWRFGPPPSGCGSLLGGAGMAVSSRSAIKEKAVDFASWYCRDEGQLLAGRNCGQPAGLAAWEDAVANSNVDEFFLRTRKTQEAAFIRPISCWWPAFQKEAGIVFADRLRRKVPAHKIVGELETIYGRYTANPDEGRF